MSLNIQTNALLPQNQIAFKKGNASQRIKQILNNQKGHLFVQGFAWTASEAMLPSTNLMDVIINKIGIDIAEFVGNAVANKLLNTQINTTVKNCGLNVFSYINLLINKKNFGKLYDKFIHIITPEISMTYPGDMYHDSIKGLLDKFNEVDNKHNAFPIPKKQNFAIHANKKKQLPPRYTNTTKIQRNKN